MPPRADVAVIVVTWNNESEIAACLAALRMQHGAVRLDVWIVDNASTDRTVAQAQATFPEGHFLINTKNRGFAAACNQAIRASQSRYVLILNPDTRVQPETVATFVSLLDGKAQVGIAGCRLLNADGTVQPSVSRFPTLASQLRIVLKVGHFFPTLARLRQNVVGSFSYDREQTVDQVKGACFFVRRAMLEAIGLFDERFWIWFEEVDLCKRAADHGWEVLYTPQTSVVHLGGRSFRHHSPLRNQWLFLQSLLRYFAKHRPAWETAMLALVAPIGLFLVAIGTLIRRPPTV